MQVRRFTRQCLEQLCKSAGSQVNAWNNYAGPQVHRSMLGTTMQVRRFTGQCSPPNQDCYSFATRKGCDGNVAPSVQGSVPPKSVRVNLGVANASLKERAAP